MLACGMTDSQRIDQLGGTGAVAALCGLHKSSISQWRKRGIPKGWKRYLLQLKGKARAAKRGNGT
jgi:hypothetical protein